MILTQFVLIFGTPASALAEAIAWNTVAYPTTGIPRVIGTPAAGCIAGARALPPEGAGYQVIRLSRRRNYGHPSLIDFVEDFGRRISDRSLGVVLIGDMAQPRGGPMPAGHASHQTGLDVDIWFRLDLPRQTVAQREAPSEVLMADPYNMVLDRARWTRAHAELVHLAATDRRVDRIFVNPAIKKALCGANWPDRDWLRKVRPWWGHAGHLHVRLGCPAGNPECVAQSVLPPGEGCDDELDSWFPKHRVEPPKPGTIKPVRRSPKLPEACQGVMSAAPVRAATGGAE